MAAANTDNFLKVRRKFSTTIGGGGVTDGVVTTIPLTSTTNLPTDTAITITINRVDGSGNVISPDVSETCVGTVVGTNLTNAIRGVEGTAVAHAAGQVVECLWTETNVNRAMTALLVEHNQSGTHNISSSSLISQYAADTGAANAYVVTLSPVPGSYVAGMQVTFKAANANTTTSTINVNALGVKTIKKLGGAANLSANDIQVGQICACIYDGTNFQLVSPSGITLNTTDTQTVTNKRVTRRVVTVTQSATPAINSDTTDVAQITGIAQAITSMTTSLTGTPVTGDLLEIQFTDNGTARAITWGASFVSTTVTLPTTTVISTLLRVLVEWNGSAWACVATA